MRVPAVVARLLTLTALVCGVLGAQDVVISLTASGVVYTPFFCEGGERCAGGGWQRETIESGAVVITTSGSGEEGIVPQMFLEFRASALYLSTSALSTANVSATISQGGTATYQNVTSSTGLIAIVGLEGAALSTLALTYIGPGRFDLSQMWLTVDDELATLTSSFLPSLSAPPSATLPVFTTGAPTIVASQPSVPQDNRSRNLAYPLGLTLGLGLGLTTLAACSYALWRRWRRRRKDRELEEAKEQEAWERRKGKLRADIVP